jgi:hypothetical protein
MVEERTSIEEIPLESSAIEPAHRRGARGITGAVLLIGLGTALLLSNLGIIQLNWLTLVQFWPVVLILIGLDIAFGGRSAVGSVVVALVALAVVFGAIFWSGVLGNGVNGSGSIIEGTFKHDIGNAESLRATLDLGVADVEVGALNSDTQAVSGNYRTDERFQIAEDYRTEGDTGILTVEQKSENNNFNGMAAGDVNLELTNSIPLDLQVNAGVGSVTLDLSDILLVNLTIDAGVGSVTVMLPEGQTYSVDIDAGVGSVDVDLPEDDEIRINYDGGLGSLDLDEKRFHEVSEDVWETDNYSEGDGIEINVDAGVGSVDFN